MSETEQMERLTRADRTAGKYCWGIGDEEQFHHADTEQEAHDAARDRIAEDFKVGTRVEYTIARLAHPLDCNGPNYAASVGDAIATQIDEELSCVTGHEDQTMFLEAGQAKELGEIVLKWLRENADFVVCGIAPGSEMRHSYAVPEEMA